MTFRPAFLIAILALAACEFEGAPVPESEPGTEDPNGDNPTDPPDDVDPTADSDGDGFDNDSDNCWAIPNPLQLDEDDDGRGDACDNCPITPNADQLNNGELDADLPRDALGDACDPRPAEAGDRLTLFNPFNDSLDETWVFAVGSNQWSVEDGKLVREDNFRAGTVYWTGAAVADATIKTRVTVGAMNDGDDDSLYGVAVVANFNGLNGYACIESMNRDSQANTVSVYSFQPEQVQSIATPAAATPSLESGRTIDLTMVADGSPGDFECSRSSERNDAETQVAGQPPAAAGFVGVHSFRTAVAYDYIVVYGR